VSFKGPSSISKSDWLNGLQTLNRLWGRDLLPQDLERHYFLHWFVVYEGNILKTAEALQVHRNTIQGHFLSLGYSKKSVRLRHAWQTIRLQAHHLSFENKFFAFYKRFGVRPRLNPKENTDLIRLWKIRFPYKTLAAHYLLWAQRAGKSKDWMIKRLDYSFRHRARLLSQVVQNKTRDGFWLSPLKPTLDDIRSARSAKMTGKKK
jgi:hypothetical protein